MTYLKALDHFQQCQFETFYCPYKCKVWQGEGGGEWEELRTFKGKDLEAHLKICEEVGEECSKCGLFKKRNEEHDCFKALMDQIDKVYK